MRYGFPHGLFNIVIGDSEKITDMWARHEYVHGVVFLGDAKTARKVHEKFSSMSKKFIGESNGNDAVFIDKGWSISELERIVRHAVDGRMVASGQFCIGVKRLFVHEELYEEVVEIAYDQAQRYKAGLVSDPETTLIPVSKIDKCQGWLSGLERDGGRKILGGYRMNYQNEPDEKGIFYAPTLVIDVSPANEIMNGEEIFAPILPISKVGGVKEAVMAINRSPYRLKATIYSLDRGTIKYFCEGVKVGTVNVNVSHFTWNGGVFVGGRRDSSITDRGVSIFAELMTYPKMIHIGTSLNL